MVVLICIFLLMSDVEHLSVSVGKTSRFKACCWATFWDSI